MNDDKKQPMLVKIKQGPSEWVKTGFWILLLVVVVLALFFQPDQPRNWEYMDEGLAPYTTAPAVDENTALVGLMDLSGIILNQAMAPTGVFQTQSYITPTRVREELNAFKEEKLDALVIKVTTPGGSVQASDELARLIKVFSQNDIPVIVYTSSLLASGGYYMAAPADAIYAAPQAMVGSIGVLFQTVNAQKLVEDKLGVQVRVFKEGRYKDMGSPFKELSPAEEEIIREHISDAYEAFLQTILDGREISREALLEVATGQVFTGNEAAERKLVDGALYLDELADRLKQDTGKQKLVFQRYRRPAGFLQQLFLGRQAGSPSELAELLAPLSRYTLPTGLYYLMDR